MAEMAFPLGKDEYITEIPVQMWLGTRESGVFSAEDNLRVTTDDGMRVKVLDGLAWIRFAKYRGIMYGNTNWVAFTISPSDAYQKRIDRVVVRFDIVSNEVKLKIKEGTFSANPVPPELQRDEGVAWELGLADIYVRPGSDSILASDITDTRLNKDLCGLMRDGVDGIPTEALQQQYSAWFQNLKTSAESGADALSTWINSFKDNTSIWLAVFKADTSNWFTNYKNTSEADLQAWYTMFTQAAETEFNNWMAELTEMLPEEDLVGELVMRLNNIDAEMETIKTDVLEVGDDLSEFMKEVSFNFDNDSHFQNYRTEIAFPNSYTITEARRHISTGEKVAERVTTFKTDGNIEETLRIFSSGALSKLYTITTSFYGDNIYVEVR